MANGKIRFGKQSGGELALVIPDGVANTEVTFPESGVLATINDINTAGIELKTIATGTATFTATTNNIKLTGIGVGVEIGDVIQISGATDSKNNSEFTVEVITDDDNIIVNQAHANKGTTKNVANRDSDTGVTVKLLAKWYNAPIGLGQGCVSVIDIRSTNTAYGNNTNRAIISKVICQSDGVGTVFFKTSGINTDANYEGSAFSGTIVTGIGDVIPYGASYEYATIGTSGDRINSWAELR